MLDEIRKAFSKKDVINYLLLGITALAIPLTVGTINQQRILKSRAQNPPIQFVANPLDSTADVPETRSGKLVLPDSNKDGIYRVYVKLESPLGPPAGTLTAGSSTKLASVSLVRTALAQSCNPGSSINSCKNNTGTGHTYCVYSEDGNYESGCVIESCWVNPGKGPFEFGGECPNPPACWNDGGWVDKDSADNGCSQTHGSGSTCSQSSSGPYGDGCTLGSIPTTAPTNAPTTAPTTAPTNAPTTAPTTAPTNAPTTAPTTAPTNAPTTAPTTAPTNAPTTAPTTPPTTPPGQKKTEKFKIAVGSLADLATAAEKNYTTTGQQELVTFTNPTIGVDNFVFVEFIGKDERGNVTRSTPAENAAITLLAPNPVITGSSCNIDVDLKDGSLKFSVSGTNFGTRDFTNSKLTADSQTLEIREWLDTKVVARMPNPPDITKGKTYGVTLNRSDNAQATATCSVDTTQVSVGARLFCRTPSNFDQDNVVMSVFEMLGVGASAPTASSKVASSIQETVTVSKEGVISNIKAQLKEGALYTICLLAPRSLRACTNQFTAVASGNNILTNFDLAVGDLNGDCKINSVDAATLRQQWGPLTGTKNCDFNKDQKCNSFEWACMLHDFDKSCTEEPK